MGFILEERLYETHIFHSIDMGPIRILYKSHRCSYWTGIMIMIICIHKKDTLQIMVTNKQQCPNLRMPVESYKKLIWLVIIILILQI